MFWFSVYFLTVVLCVLALKALLGVASLPIFSGSGDREWHDNLQGVYEDGSLYDAECHSMNFGQLSDKYSPEQTRKIFDASGLMDGSARKVAASGFAGEQTYRYEPKNGTRPTIITSTDNIYYSNNSRQCILNIIE